MVLNSLFLNLLLFVSVVSTTEEFRNNSAPNTWTNLTMEGDPVQPNEFPWVVILEIKTTGGYKRCGGALISMDTVLTAAHCLSDKSIQSVRVVAGEQELNIYEGTEQSAGTTSITFHEDYDNVTLFNDVALINLSTPFTRTAAVAPIKLPSPHFKCWRSGIVAGWGWGKNDSRDNPSFPSTLQKVTFPIRNGRHCKKQSRGRNQFCAGGKVCKGDSGSPLVCISKPGTIYGIVSGISTENFCAVRNWPAFYTRVPAYIPWIKSKLRLYKLP